MTGTAIKMFLVGVPSIPDKHCAFTETFWKIFESNFEGEKKILSYKSALMDISVEGDRRYLPK